ncbi:MAG: NAD(P)-binding domain-containing protein, partial [Chloroflexi bacterium]|nr:NAD(P)-binding domain-containing protein [Chloroflexota bacterium]
MTTILDAVVVGAGQAGIGMSYLLKQKGFSHIVFERERIGETWRSQRWDSFAVNTPNWSNALPGSPYDGEQPDGFWLRDEMVDYLQHYVDRFALPVQTGITVTSVDQDGKNFLVRTENGSGESTETTARNVVVASGIMQRPKIPALSQAVPEDILQLHTGTYHNPDALPDGAVVIVGGGQSGCQIAEDLVGTGHEIYLCSSKVGRAPRRYRGQELMYWFEEMGFWSVKATELEDLAVIHAAQPLISGVGRYGHSVSLQYLAQQGVKVVGRLVEVKDGVLRFDESARENVFFGDAFAERLLAEIDEYIESQGLNPAPNEHDPADLPDPQAASVTDIEQLSLSKAGVSTIIWATGFTANFDWLHLPVLDSHGMPVHELGTAPVEGIYFLGFPWLSSRKSG